MQRLIEFLRQLEATSTAYQVGYYTASDIPVGSGTITVHVTPSPSERWEVEFHEDGSVDVERFGSLGIVDADLDALVDELRQND